MCGIIGIVTTQEADVTAMLQRSLSWLTYRGYDSWGIAVKVDNKLKIIRNKGLVVDHRLELGAQNKIGIGHTRWATHGAPNEENAHPQSDCRKNIAVVHNGIIDNYEEIKETLITQGHQFKSETDTEVIPHLIEEKLKNHVRKNYPDAFLFAFKDTIKELKGTFAIVALWNQGEKIYAARRKNPLLIGITHDMHFVSSDIPAFLEYTNEFVALEDEQIAVVSADKFELYDFELNEQTSPRYTYPFTIEQISKGKYDYYMLKEIEEQDKVLRRILDNHSEIEKIAKELLDRKLNKACFVGCGSSFHACVAGKYMFERLLEVPSEAILSSEFKLNASNIHFKDALNIIVSQSGETLDSYLVFENILSFTKTPNLLAVTNIPYGSMERMIRNGLTKNISLLRLHAGQEICVVATKTYTAQLYLLALLTLQTGLEMSPERRKKDLEVLLKGAHQIPEKACKILEGASMQIQELAYKYKKYPHFFTIGRGINLATASEGALKLKEICYVPAEGMAGGELKHGSLAVVDKHSPVIVLFPPSSDKAVWKSTLNNFREIQARGAPIISICCESDEKGELGRLSSDVLAIPQTEWLFSPILQGISLQLLSYHIAIQKGLDPDHPRHLAKVVTVE